MTPLEYLEIENKDLINKLEKNLLRGKVTKVMIDFAKQYHKKQLILSGVVKSFVCDCPNESWVYDESGVDMYCKNCSEE